MSMKDVIDERNKYERLRFMTVPNVIKSEEEKKAEEAEKAEKDRIQREFNEKKEFIESISPYYKYNMGILLNLEKDINDFIEKYNYLENFIKKYNCKTKLDYDDVIIKVSKHEELRNRLLKQTESFNDLISPNRKHIEPGGAADKNTFLVKLSEKIIKLTNYLNNEAKKSNNEEGKDHFKYISHTDSLQETLDIINPPPVRGIEGGKKSKKQPKKEILGVMRCIYKIPGDRKEYVKHKGKLITIKDFKEFMKPKNQDKPKKLTKPKKQTKPKKRTKTK